MVFDSVIFIVSKPMYADPLNENIGHNISSSYCSFGLSFVNSTFDFDLYVPLTGIRFIGVYHWTLVTQPFLKEPGEESAKYWIMR